MRNSFYIFLLGIGLISACTTEKAAQSGKSNSSKNDVEVTYKDRVNFEHLFHNANKERLLGNYKEAAALFYECLNIIPKEPVVHYELAKLFDLSNQYEVSLKHAKEAVALSPDNYWYRNLYAFVLQRTGNAKEAVKQYETLITQYPEKVDLYYELAGIQLYLEQYDNALKSYSKLEEKMGVMEEITLQKQKIYIKQNKLDDAVKELNKLIDSNPSEVRYKSYLAELYLANEMEDKAFEIYHSILATNPDDPYAHLALHDYYKQKGDSEKAYDEIQQVFSNKHFDLDAKMQILLTYYSHAETDGEVKKEAHNLNKLLIKTHPDEAKPYTIYGDFLYQDKKLESANKNYLKAIELDSSKFAIWSQVMFIEGELEDYDNMLIHAKKAVELFPNQPIFYYFYGVANIQKKNYEEAAEYMALGVDFVVDNPPLKAQFYASLGDSYYQIKDYVNSDANYEKALKIEPDNIYVLNNFSYYLSLRNEKLDLAEEMSARTNEIEPNQANYEDTYGWILYQQGKYVVAREWLEKSLTHGGDKNPVILEHLGDVNAKLNNLTKAVEYWQKAKDLGGKSDFLDKKIADKKLYE